MALVIGVAFGGAGVGLCACSDSKQAEAPVEASAPPDAGAPDTSPRCGLERAGTISGKVISTPGKPNAGVQVCVYQRPDLPCVTTAEDGTYEHTCLPEGDTAVLFSKEGHASTLWLRVVTAGIGQHLDTYVLPDSENTKLFGTVGVTYPRAGHGMVTLNDLSDTGQITVTAEGAATDGPFYSRDAVTIDRDAGATVGNGIVFLVAPVGSLKLRMTTPDAKKCQQVLGGWGSVDNTITVPVVENTETSVFINCAK
jgi:hypothetical protein